MTSKKGFDVVDAICLDVAGTLRVAHAPSAVESTLVAWYAFDHSLPIDMSGRGHHLGPGAISSGPGFESRGSLAAFLPTSSAPDAVGKAHADFVTPAFSISMWVFLLEDSSGWRTLLSKGHTSDDLTPSILLRPGERKLRVALRTGSEWQEGAETQGELPRRRWTHIAVTVDSILRIYINGIKQAEVILQGPVRHSDGDIYIGKDPWRMGANAYIDDVRWYNVALTQSQVLATIIKHAPFPISIACPECEFQQATKICMDRNAHLCTTTELRSGAYQATRALGFPQEAWLIEGAGKKIGVCCHAEKLDVHLQTG